jgi:hypothetical protein
MSIVLRCGPGQFRRMVSAWIVSNREVIAEPSSWKMNHVTPCFSASLVVQKRRSRHLERQPLAILIPRRRRPPVWLVGTRQRND